MALSAHDLFELFNLQFSKVSEIMMSKYATGALPDKVTPYISFKDEAVVKYYVPVVKILLQVITDKF